MSANDATGRAADTAARPYGAVVLAAPAVALWVAFQNHFTSSDLGSGMKG